MILITGAAGHIGNNLVREFLKGGYPVRALILPGEDTTAIDGLNIERVEGNILDPDSLTRAMQGVDQVFHLAGVISILSGRDEFVRQVNIQGTKNVVAAAMRSGVKRLLYTSSIHALSRECSGVIDENVPFDPQNSAGEYDRTKAEASLAVLEAVQQGLDAVIVCPTGVIGPYDYRNSEVGELLRDWMQTKTHILVEGGYDFVDVRDVAHGMLLASQKGKKGGVYILSGEQISLLRMKELVQHAVGIHTPTIQAPMWLARLASKVTPLYYRMMKQTPKFTEYSLRTVCDNSKISSDRAQRELGYSARPLSQTIADTVEWWRTQAALQYSKNPG